MRQREGAYGSDTEQVQGGREEGEGGAILDEFVEMTGYHRKAVIPQLARDTGPQGRRLGRPCSPAHPGHGPLAATVGGTLGMWGAEHSKRMRRRRERQGTNRVENRPQSRNAPEVNPVPIDLQGVGPYRDLSPCTRACLPHSDSTISHLDEERERCSTKRGFSSWLWRTSLSVP